MVPILYLIALILWAMSVGYESPKLVHNPVHVQPYEEKRDLLSLMLEIGLR